MELLISEILDKVSKIKSKKDKVKFLQDNNTDSLRMVLKSGFDPRIRMGYSQKVKFPYTR